MNTTENEQDYTKQFEQEYEEQQKNMVKPNILIMGATGAGKSTLINLVLGEEQAKTGAGAPVTRGVHRYDGCKLVNVFDSEGYETGDDNQKKYEQLISEFIEKMQQETDAKKRLHLVWYCVNLPCARFTELDKKLINKIKEMQLSIAVVLTQIDATSEDKAEKMKEEIRNQCNNIQIFETTNDQKLESEIKGISLLLKWSVDHLPRECQDAFIYAIKDIDLKFEAAKSCVLQHSLIAAATVGATTWIPVPFSDAPALVSNQIAMLARLSSIWDLPNLKTLAGGGVVSMGMSAAGKLFVGTIVKFIPGLGTAAGTIINAGVASSLTLALGYATNETCKRIKKDQLDSNFIALQSYFDSRFKDSLQQLFKQAQAKKNA